jgi:cysteine/O-acetylserine efflux protein
VRPGSAIQLSNLMPTSLVAFLSFVIVTTFTPGPNNISSASMGVLHGYRKTLPYLLGIATGFALVMWLCGWISSTLMRWMPTFEGALRWVGAAYILWLAIETWRASYQFEEEGQARLGLVRGLLLQMLNVKAIVYGLTIYTSWPSLVASSPLRQVVSALALAGIAFVATSTWALGGAAIRTQLRQPQVRRWVNASLALLLVYAAVELSGILQAVR